MSKHRTVVPIEDHPRSEPEPGLITLMVGSARHVLNWRTGQEVPPPAGQLVSFPSQTPFVSPDGLAIGAAPSDLCPDRNKRQGVATNMKRFSITPDNAVSVLRDDQSSAPENTVFHSEQEIETVSSHWPVSGLVDIWNGLPGTAAIRKFQDRRTAVSRIWKQMQSLEPAEIPPPIAAAEPEQANGASAEPATNAISRKDHPGAAARAGWSDSHPDDGRDRVAEA